MIEFQAAQPENQKRLVEIAQLLTFDPDGRTMMIWFDLYHTPDDYELVKRHLAKQQQVVKLTQDGTTYSMMVHPSPHRAQHHPRRLLVWYKIQAISND